VFHISFTKVWELYRIKLQLHPPRNAVTAAVIISAIKDMVCVVYFTG